ncbi:beige/beach-related [Anaeramoeba ignava]|uniref:Beige/beach-related n=1 Tax=Anaeramoeba ignava TaxID=1746090 RepID=A0A9Q0LKI4_ANAIG|nr:beige/beach-related [Anaeramoeba ignava]
MKPENLRNLESKTQKSLLRKSQITKKWQKRQITNFDYLMELNIIAGRSYNDISQYPVFPWIISNYESEELDLKDEKNYRDLSKPMGALNEERLQEFIQRYENFQDPDNVIPPFHYGSHYSSTAIVLFYLIRVEPFTTLAINLQGGKFDHADRIFIDVVNTWKNCLTNSSDVKELIPEFFYFPEFLQNLNKFDLGKRQSGKSN